MENSSLFKLLYKKTWDRIILKISGTFIDITEKIFGFNNQTIKNENGHSDKRIYIVIIFEY